MAPDEVIYEWNPSDLLEISLAEPGNFLKIKETLTRIGIASKALDDKKRLFQSCHILHKQGRYFIVHFKELFILDGKESNLTVSDVQRRNTIALLLQEWNLLSIISEIDTMKEAADINGLKIISHKDKGSWVLVPKYTIGAKKK